MIRQPNFNCSTVWEKMIKQSINNHLQDNKVMEIVNTDLSRATYAKPIKFPSFTGNWLN